ncbi:MAG: hypothetical protein IT373_21600 [Polyangiaceae bacterium]|nr:hypothetical protein [Polyangiaceae bacterium]
MATKAERFRAAEERTKAKKPKSAPRPRRDEPVDTSEPGVTATDRKAGAESTAARNRKARAGRRGGVKLEDSKNGKPSRKSTRGSADRTKATSNLQRRHTRAITSPDSQARRAKAARRP